MQRQKKINKGGFTGGKTSIQGKRETENSSFKGGDRKKDKRQLTPKMLIRMVMNHVPSSAHPNSYLLHVQFVVSLNGQR